MLRVTRKSDGSNDENQPFQRKEEYELAHAVEEGLITTLRSDVGDTDGNSAFRFYTPFQAVDRAGSLNHRNDDFKGVLIGYQENNWNARFENFQRVRIG